MLRRAPCSGAPLDLDPRSGRKTCVPAHWVVSTEEDAEVAAALREAPAP